MGPNGSNLSSIKSLDPDPRGSLTAQCPYSVSTRWTAITLRGGVACAFVACAFASFIGNFPDSDQQDSQGQDSRGTYCAEKRRRKRGSRRLVRFMQLKSVVDDLQCLGSIILRNNAADLDLAGGDVLNIDLGVRQGLEHP